MRLTHSPKYRWIILGTAFLGVLAALGLGRFGYSAILPSMQTALGLNNIEAGSLASWNLGGYVVMAAIGGFLASRFGARKIVAAGLAVTALGMLLTGFSGGLFSASLARLLTGFGSGLVLVPSVAMMATWFDSKRRGFASAIVASGPALALVAVGPLVPKVIASGGAGGWRLAWYLFAAVTICVGILTIFVQRDRPYETAAAAAASARAREASPSDWKSVVRSRYAWHLGSVYFLYGFAYMIYFVFFQKRLVHDLGFSSQRAGTLYMILGISSLVCGVLWGYVSDRVGRKQAIAAICALEAIAAALFAFVPTTAGFVSSSIIFGLTALSVPGIVGPACGDAFGAEMASASLGLLTLFLGIGQAVGPLVAGRIADASSSFGSSYALAACLFVVAAIVAAFLRERGPAPQCAASPMTLARHGKLEIHSPLVSKQEVS